jgi:methylated-DNA-[protein]-cysteine S-methyltransferase
MTAQMYRSYYPSEIGLLEIVVTDRFVVSLEFVPEITTGRHSDGVFYMKTPDRHPLLKACARQLDEYFNGGRKEFTLPLRPEGTPFQKSAWEELIKIPYGTVISYGEQARRMSKEKAVRAVGGANGKNKIVIVIPCHRVIGKDGSLTGFGAGMDRKQWLLEHERKNLND